MNDVLNACILILKSVEIYVLFFLVMIFVFYYRFMTKMLSEVTISWARQSLTFLKTLNSKCKCPEGCQLKKVVLLFVATKFALCYNLLYFLQAWRAHFEAS